MKKKGARKGYREKKGQVSMGGQKFIKRKQKKLKEKLGAVRFEESQIDFANTLWQSKEKQIRNTAKKYEILVLLLQVAESYCIFHLSALILLLLSLLFIMIFPYFFFQRRASHLFLSCSFFIIMFCKCQKNRKGYASFSLCERIKI